MKWSCWASALRPEGVGRCGVSLFNLSRSGAHIGVNPDILSVMAAMSVSNIVVKPIRIFSESRCKAWCFVAASLKTAFKTVHRRLEPACSPSGGASPSIFTPV